MTMRECFRPRSEPARTFFDAIWEADLGTDPTLVAWQSARDYAQQQGLEVLTLSDVEDAETTAVGHIDYAAKFAWALERRFQNGD